MMYLLFFPRFFSTWHLYEAFEFHLMVISTMSLQCIHVKKDGLVKSPFSPPLAGGDEGEGEGILDF